MCDMMSIGQTTCAVCNSVVDSCVCFHGRHLQNDGLSIRLIWLQRHFTHKPSKVNNI